MPLIRWWHPDSEFLMTLEIPLTCPRFLRLADVPTYFPPPEKTLRLLLIADDRHPANVVQDHINAIRNLSCHDITVVNSRHLSSPAGFYARDYDGILIHYSIFMIEENYLSIEWRDFIAHFAGVVAAIHEDEYQNINAFRARFAELGVQAVFSCLDSPATMERVYGGGQLRNTIFISCLPGYIPLNFPEFPSPPVATRPFDVVYRGRDLPPELGKLGQEKRIIGDQMQDIARRYGLRVDISSAEDARIYGPAWPQFLASGKAMLGVEGGSSIFDFDGSLRQAVNGYKDAHPGASFEEIWEAVLSQHEGNIDFRTLTPKFFEAIAARTALVLYPGHYNGILIRDRHYIALERDGSNAREVVERLRDDAGLQAMVDRTVAEVLQRADLTSAFYVDQIDRVFVSLANADSVDRRLRALPYFALTTTQLRLVQAQCQSLQAQCLALQSGLDQLNKNRNASILRGVLRFDFGGLSEKYRRLRSFISSKCLP